MSDSEATVNRSLERIKDWLDKHGCSLGLRPAATEFEIAQVESALGRALSPDLRAAYLDHDGQDYEGRPWLFESQRWLPIGEIVAAHQLASCREGEVAGPVDGPIRPVAWSDGWIPFAQAADGDLTCVDLDPRAERSGRAGHHPVARGGPVALAGRRRRLVSGRARRPTRIGRIGLLG